MIALFNRELSWLAFNQRVLAEASNTALPLLERAHFLAITESNLDEFVAIRLSALKREMEKDPAALAANGIKITTLLPKVLRGVSEQLRQQQQVWQALLKDLQTNGLAVVAPANYTANDKARVGEIFSLEIAPHLRPVVVQTAADIPFLPSRHLLLLVQLPDQRMVVVPVPATLPRLLPIGVRRYTLLEDAIIHNLDHLVQPKPDFLGLMRVLRDAELPSHVTTARYEHFEQILLERQRGAVMLTQLAGPKLATVQKLVHPWFDRDDLMPHRGILGYAAAAELAALSLPEHHFHSFTARFPERIDDCAGDYFAAIAQKDFIVHHPYETFEVVVNFLQQAAQDKTVTAIEHTLYRTTGDSPIVAALIAAAKRGVMVTSVIEIKARFDEANNLALAKRLEQAGARVILGRGKHKVHAKITVVTRQEKTGLRRYTHFGTGNYHPDKARVFSDLSLFTAEAQLSNDASALFAWLRGETKALACEKLIIAPVNLRRSLLALIQQEADYARAKKPAAIWAKMNALTDPAIIAALYDAAAAGVPIELYVRGACCLVPTAGVRVRSMVGRFLEHARIFAFGAGHGLPSPQAAVYISSADWMTRNLDYRVETMVPLLNPTVHQQVLGQVLAANRADVRQTWELKPSGHYDRLPATPQAFAAHDYFISNPSLSGRGQRAQKMPLTIPPAS